MNSFVSLFFAAMFTAYFIHFHFANPGYSLEIHFAERIRPTNMKQFFISTPGGGRIASLFSGGWPPLIGGDSEDITRSSPAVQIGLEGRADDVLGRRTDAR
ncbi:hypothetical protein ACX80S_17410 [Arthrobacter sp. RHLT1-20]